MQRKLMLVLITLWFAVSSLAYAQGTLEDYRRAEMFLPWNIEKQVLNSSITPRWIAKSDRFWYLRKTRTGKEFILVDPVKNTQEPLFNHTRFATALTAALDTVVTPMALPFDRVEVDDNLRIIRFDVRSQGWQCDLATYSCTRLARPIASPPGELRSPDGRWAAFLRDHNLFVRHLETEEDHQLSFDGAPHYAYGSPAESNLHWVTDRRAGLPITPVGIWSPDSRHLLTQRLDERKVGELHLLQAVPDQGYGRPRLYSYRYPLPGDSVVPVAELVIFNRSYGV